MPVTSAVKKVISKIKSPPTTGGHQNKMSREEMISVAAYYRAEHRGFSGGDAVADWLAAEAEIDAASDNSQKGHPH